MHANFIRAIRSLPGIHNRWKRLSWRKCLSHEVARFGMLPLALHTWTAASNSYSHFGAHFCDLHPDCITWSWTSSTISSIQPFLPRWILYFLYTCSRPFFIQGVRKRSVTSSYTKPRRNESIEFIFNFISRFGYNFKEMRRKCLCRDRCQDLWMKRYGQDDITELETSFYAILSRVSSLSLESSFLGHDTG